MIHAVTPSCNNAMELIAVVQISHCLLHLVPGASIILHSFPCSRGWVGGWSVEKLSPDSLMMCKWPINAISSAGAQKQIDPGQTRTLTVGERPLSSISENVRRVLQTSEIPCCIHWQTRGTNQSAEASDSAHIRYEIH